MPHGEQTAFGVPIVTQEVFNFLAGKVMSLEVSCWSNEERIVQVRGFTRHGFISHDHTTNADRSVSTTEFRIQDFPLEFQVSTTDTSVRRGELYVRVNLMMGGFRVGCLCAGYVTDEEFPCYPMQQPYKSIDGRGVIRSIAGTNPAAGAEISETVPTNARWRLIALSVQFVADGTAATRLIMPTFDDGTTEYWRGAGGQTISAGQTIQQALAITGANNSSTGLFGSGMLPAEHVLLQGHRIRTLTNNLQAGDNYGAPQLLVEEWIEE